MGIFKSLDNLQDKPEMLTSAKFSTIEYNYSTILENIQNGTYSNSKIQEMIINNCAVYLNYDNFTNPATRTVFQALWTDKRFLQNFVTVLKESPEKDKLINYIRNNHLVSINRIVYDYYASADTDKNAEVVDLLLKICEIIDYVYIRPLTSIMEPTAAKFMTLSNFSSDDVELCVNRLNKLIIKAGYDFSVSDIVYIYSKFYLNAFSLLFEYTMTSVFDGLTPNEQHNNDRINLALVNILNNMTETDIYKTVSQYASYIMLMQKAQIRFSLRSLSADFSRVNEVVEQLLSEGVPIP